MWGVFTNYMGLHSDDIVAMTTLNFTSATDPKNASSVYKGSSPFTRCVWEVRLGNAVRFPPTFPNVLSGVTLATPQDLCVGDFWETQERRSITSFTTAIAVDKFQLVTLLRPPAAASVFEFPETPSLSR